MVNADEGIDLDPSMEDILSVWGEDPTPQNIKHFFGTVEALATRPFSSEPEKLTHFPSILPKDRHETTIAFQEGKPHLSSQSTSQRTSQNNLINPPLGSKGPQGPAKSVLSGGLEDFVILGAKLGHSPAGNARSSAPITRASIAAGRNSTLEKGGLDQCTEDT